MAAPAPARPRVLMLSPYFLPAEQGGGSMLAVLNLTRALKAAFDFTVICRDHDLHGTESFPETQRACAREAADIDIRYLPRSRAGLRQLHTWMGEPADLVYLHSLMALDLGLAALLCRRLQRRPAPLLVAPRGELMPGALSQRAGLKRGYLALLQASGALRDAQFHATSRAEVQAIRDCLGQQATVHLVPDLPQAPPAHLKPQDREPGPLRVLFLSRLDPVKNLGFAIGVMARLRCAAQFTIAGPVGDAELWAENQSCLRGLPAHIQTNYLGPIPPANVAALMAKHDLLLLPTLGENHGYVIAEALAAGCAVLVSDRTPWRGLQAAGVGADLPLHAPDAFVEMLEQQAAMSAPAWLAQRQRCHEFAVRQAAAHAGAPAMQQLLSQLTQPKARMVSTSVGQSGGL